MRSGREEWDLSQKEKSGVAEFESPTNDDQFPKHLRSGKWKLEEGGKRGGQKLKLRDGWVLFFEFNTSLLLLQPLPLPLLSQIASKNFSVLKLGTSCGPTRTIDFFTFALFYMASCSLLNSPLRNERKKDSLEVS